MPTTIAIVGRPNVGKSTLFNRLLKKNIAITHDRPGVTRDRIYGELVFGARDVALIDTGGMEIAEDKESVIDEGIFDQAREAVNEAQGILLVMDGREGITPLDQRVAEFIRRSDKPVYLVVNKVDGPENEALMTAEFHALGFPMVACSAEHGFNLNFLRRVIEKELLPQIPEPPKPASEAELGLCLAMLGRPNAGKSSMINAITGEDRLIVSSEAGTTRDAVDVTLERSGKRYTFVDTAGVRKRTKIDDAVERFSVIRALKSSKRANVTIMVLDAMEGVSTQDKKLLDFLLKESVPFIIAINKMDLVPKNKVKAVKEFFDEELRMCHYVPVVYTSTLSKAGLGGILPLAEKLWAECQIRVSTGALNRAMRTALERHQPPQVKFRRAKFYYLTQTGTTPPTFVFFVNHPKLVKESYKRYLENQLRKNFDMKMAPLRIFYRESRDTREQ